MSDSRIPEYAAVLDLSGDVAKLAASRDGETVLSVSRPMRGRDASALSEWLVKSFAENGIPFDRISAWTVGAGPGGFTGMRQAAALVCGLRHNRPQVRCRCVPGAVALGLQAELGEGETLTTLFDGRNRELLGFELIGRGGEAVPTGVEFVTDAAGAPARLAGKKLAGLAADRAAIAAIAPEAAVQWFETLEIERLLGVRYQPFDGVPDRLVYIRPAVQPKGA